MALGKAKQIERSPLQRLCSASNRCECRQLVRLQQPCSCDDRCQARGARAEQHPCPGGAPRHRRGPPGITLLLSLPPSLPPQLCSRCRALWAAPCTPRRRQRLRHHPRHGTGASLPVHLLIHNARLRGQQPRNPLGRDRQELPWKVTCDLRNTGEAARPVRYRRRRQDVARRPRGTAETARARAAPQPALSRSCARTQK